MLAVSESTREILTHRVGQLEKTLNQIMEHLVMRQQAADAAAVADDEFLAQLERETAAKQRELQESRLGSRFTFANK